MNSKTFGSTTIIWQSVFLLQIVALCGAALGVEKDTKPSQTISVRAEAFPLQQVRLLDGRCKDEQELTRRYLLALESDRMLYNYRVNAGIDAPNKPYGGWDSPSSTIRGEFVGHYLSALALMYASTGDQEIKQRGDLMVAELAKCQKALGGEYLAAFPVSFIDRLEAGKPEPCTYYVIHKIMAGMFDMYDLCGNKQALDVLKGMASYFGKRMGKLSDEQLREVLDTTGPHPYKETSSMGEVFSNLYAVTGDPKYLQTARKFLPPFLDTLAQKQDNLTGRHANAHSSITCGAARYYELTGDEKYHTAVCYLWDRVINCRSYATGGGNYSEHWLEPNNLAESLLHRSQEFCPTFNLLKLARYQFRWTGDSRYADYYERAFFNCVLGQQIPEGIGLYHYFTPLIPGATRKEGSSNRDPFGSFWCCYGTSVQSNGKLGDSIYFHDDDGIYVNLFVASKLTWPEKNLILEQRTEFPARDTMTFTLRTTDAMLTYIPVTLYVHVPYWAKQGVKVKVNGEPVEAKAAPSSYLALKRQWGNGDKVEVQMPMGLHVYPMPDDPEMVAVMYGPLVLAGLTDTARNLVGDPTDAASWLKAVEGKPLTFKTIGQEPDITFMPLNKLIDERYSVYWVVAKKGSARQQKIIAQDEALRKLQARTIDRVLPNNEQSEASHNLKGESMEANDYFSNQWKFGTTAAAKIWPYEWTVQSGYFKDRAYRLANAEGWWSWDIKVLPDAAMSLLCTYFVDDTRPRTFEIIVNDQVIASPKLSQQQGEFLDVEYPIPAVLTRGKEKITVKFRSRENNIAGPVYGCATVKSQE
jgi:uncharacterized protein